MKYKFEDKWPTDTGIGWWNECRTELNIIIDVYNSWQMEYDFSVERSKLVLAKIEYGKQTIGASDGGSGYLEKLEEMEAFVKSKIS